MFCPSGFGSSEGDQSIRSARRPAQRLDTANAERCLRFRDHPRLADVDATIFQWEKISRCLTSGTFVVKDFGYRRSVLVLVIMFFIPHSQRPSENLSRNNRATE